MSQACAAYSTPVSTSVDPKMMFSIFVYHYPAVRRKATTSGWRDDTEGEGGTAL